MTRQQIEGYAAIVVSALSRCTRKGLEYLSATHNATIVLLNWHMKRICRIDEKGIAPCQQLMTAIQAIQHDTSMYRSASEQPTIEWEEVKL